MFCFSLTLSCGPLTNNSSPEGIKPGEEKKKKEEEERGSSGFEGAAAPASPCPRGQVAAGRKATPGGSAVSPGIFPGGQKRTKKSYQVIPERGGARRFRGGMKLRGRPPHLRGAAEPEGLGVASGLDAFFWIRQGRGAPSRQSCRGHVTSVQPAATPCPRVKHEWTASWFLTDFGSLLLAVRVPKSRLSKGLAGTTAAPRDEPVLPLSVCTCEPLKFVLVLGI